MKIGLPGKLILRDYFQENGTSRRPFLLLRISFPGRPIFIQLVPEELAEVAPHPDVDHVLGIEVGGDEEPLVKDARAHDVELPGQVVKVVALIGISLV